MLRLKLSNGEHALVDNEDYTRLTGFTWIKNAQGYAYRWEWKNNHPTSVLLQRNVLNASKDETVHNKNGDKLDAQKANLFKRMRIGPNIELVCPVCGHKYMTWPTRIRKGIKTCSRECGYKIRKERYGSDNPAWKGGITPINASIRSSGKMDRWRKAVFERDDYTCQGCGARNGNGRKVVLHADHIKQFAYHLELRFELSNGRTLCKDCHAQTETYKNNKLTYV